MYPNESARRPKDDESRVLVDPGRTGIQSSWTEGGGVLQSTSAQGGRSWVHVDPERRKFDITTWRS